MKRLIWVLLPTPALAQGWGNVAQQQEETGFSWTAPLWPAFWMAWTPATFLVVCLYLPRLARYFRPTAVVAAGAEPRLGYVLLQKSVRFCFGKPNASYLLGPHKTSAVA